jgi:hypothetical protein
MLSFGVGVVFAFQRFGFDHLVERDAFPRIEIEHQPIGMQWIGFACALRVELDRGNLREGDQPVERESRRPSPRGFAGERFKT